MKCAEEFRSRELTEPLVEEIHRLCALLSRPMRIMEVCGTHTMSLFRHGIRSLLPENITLLSGPGCPVCVTPASHIDAMLDAASRNDVIVATFGDLIRVPGSQGSLAQARAKGAQVEIVYSPMDAITLAAKETGKKVVFPGIGFETTAPTIAATMQIAQQQKIDNFFVIAAGKTMPAALEALFSQGNLEVDGLLCPGHVSAITGTEIYTPLVEKFGLGCAVAGFEPADILSGILSLVQQHLNQKPQVDNCYTRAVTREGNKRAQELIRQVFYAVDSPWRGLGSIPGSGLGIRAEYSRYDALEQLGLFCEEVPEPKGCKCGDVLQGTMFPPECPLYGKACTPLQPIGPCMVSSEGTCAAYYRYSGKK